MDRREECKFQICQGSPSVSDYDISRLVLDREVVEVREAEVQEFFDSSLTGLFFFQLDVVRLLALLLRHTFVLERAARHKSSESSVDSRMILMITMH